LLNREDSPWYPTVRLFRQTIPRVWGDVFQRVAAALKETGAPKSSTTEPAPKTKTRSRAAKNREVVTNASGTGRAS
jgi:hypothetical protein